MKKRIPVIIVIVIAAIILAVAGWFMARDAAYARGKKDGGGPRQNQNGALSAAEFGSGEWKGFMMGFPEGYDDGREDGAESAQN